MSNNICWVCSIKDLSDDYEYSYNCISKKAALRQAISELAGYTAEDYTRKGTKELANLLMKKEYEEAIKYWNSSMESDIVINISEEEMKTNTNIDDIFTLDDFTLMMGDKEE